jgi:hypothetical protein
MTEQSSTPAPRVRPWLRRFAIGGLVVLLPVVGWTVWDHVEARRFARMVDAIRAKGEPVAINRATASSASIEQTLRHYEAAAALVHTTGLYSPTGIFRRLDGPNGDDPATVMPDIRAWLETNQEAEAVLRRAPPFDAEAFTSGAADYRGQLDGLMRLASLADMRALERVDAGDPDGAAQAVLRQLQLARVLQAQTNDLGMMTAGLVIGRAASAVPSVLRLEPAPDALVALHDAFALHDRDRLIEHVTLQERAFVIGLYWDSGKGWFAPPTSAVTGVSGPVWLAVRPYLMHLVVNQVGMLTAYLERAGRPWPERLAVEDAGAPPRGPRGPLSLLLVPHSRWATVSARNTRTRFAGTLLAGVRSTLVAIAVEQYRRAHAAKLPARLDELISSDSSASAVDPFSGAPLRYAILPDSFIVYSVGTNGKDDGGQGAGTQLRRRWGANQAADNPLDIGITVGISKKAGR